MSCELVWLYIIIKCISDIVCHIEYLEYYIETTEESIWGVYDPQLSARCMLRFTPGHCTTAPRPVWTYDTRQYACVERLGCPARGRTNRFDSRVSCEMRCRDLIVKVGTLHSEVTEAPVDFRRHQMNNRERAKLEKHARDEIEDSTRQPEDS